MATTVHPISRTLAEKALKAIEQQFASAIQAGYGPKLIEGWTESGHWAICWDEGPYEWTYSAPQGGLDEEMSEMMGKTVNIEPAKDFPELVFAEPINGSVLGLYPL